MDFSLAITALSFFSGGVGAFLGSYLRKKGENLATHEDIDKLVDQVRAVTTATKQIEAKISSDLWDQQKQWELKREVLLDASKKLSELESKLSSLKTFWEHLVQGEIEGEESKIRLKHEYVTKWHDCFQSFGEIVSLVFVTCSGDTMRAFAELSDCLRARASEIVSGDLKAYAKTEPERSPKIASVRVAIRKELGTSPDPMARSNTKSAAPPS